MDVSTWTRQHMSVDSEDEEKIIVHCPRPGHGSPDKTASAAVYKQTTWLNCMKCGDIPLSKLAEELNVDPLPFERKTKNIVDRHDYYENGVLKYYKEKYLNPDGSKSFSFFGPNGEYGVKGISRVLYRVDQLRAAIKHGKTVYITEGEKDADNLVKAGYIATSSDAGCAKSWPESYLAEFKSGSKVVICPDFDEPGMLFSRMNAVALEARGVKVLWLDLGYDITTNHGADVSDWLAIGHKPEEIEKNITSKFRELQPNFKLKKLCSFSLEPPDWLINGLFESDSLAVVYGPSGAGKSFWVLDGSLCVSSGKDFHGRKTKKGPVIYLAGEGHRGIVKRTFAWCIENNIDIDEQDWWLADRPFDLMSDQSVAEVISSIDHHTDGHAPSIVVIDTLARNFGDGDENATKDMAKVIRSADAIRIKYRCLVIIVHHSGHTEGRARGNSSLRGAMEYEYEVSQDSETTIIVTNKKMKDGEKPKQMSFELVDIDLGKFVDGQKLASAVLRPVETKGEKQEKKITGENQKRAFSILESLYREQKNTLILSGLTHEPMVLIDDWRAAMKSEGMEQKPIVRAINDLERYCLITKNQPYVMIGDSMDEFIEANK